MKIDVKAIGCTFRGTDVRVIKQNKLVCIRLGFLLACSTLCAMQFNATAIFLKFIYTAIGLKNCKH